MIHKTKPCRVWGAPLGAPDKSISYIYALVDVSAALVDGSWSSVEHIGDLDKWIESKGTVR